MMLRYHRDKRDKQKLENDKRIEVLENKEKLTKKEKAKLKKLKGE